jgi:hypothetical protein
MVAAFLTSNDGPIRLYPHSVDRNDLFYNFFLSGDVHIVAGNKYLKIIRETSFFSIYIPTGSLLCYCNIMAGLILSVSLNSQSSQNRKEEEDYMLVYW